MSAVDHWWGKWVQHDGRSGILHRIDVHNCDEWEENEVSGYGVAACGFAAQFHVPGIFSRLDAPRCKKCCTKRGIAFGFGNPRNDKTLPIEVQETP